MANLLDSLATACQSSKYGKKDGEGMNFLDRIMALRDENSSCLRLGQVRDELDALAKLKKRNDEHTTPKRTKMIKALEERYRNSGIIE